MNKSHFIQIKIAWDYFLLQEGIAASWCECL